MMAGVYHNGNWVEIDGATIMRTEELEKKLSDYLEIIEYNEEGFNVRDMYSEGFRDALEWVLKNSRSHGGE